MTPSSPSEMELSSDERFVVERMRHVEGYATFRIEKKPTKRNERGELVRIVVEQSVLVPTG